MKMHIGIQKHSIVPQSEEDMTNYEFVYFDDLCLTLNIELTLLQDT